MTTRPNPSRPTMKRLACTALVSAALAGCAGTTGRTGGDLDGLRQGPGNTPQRNVTDFSSSLRCMDELLFKFGTRDVVALVEELQDQTRRLGTGTRDMMVSAVSEMTRRSRAVRLVTFGQDNQNIVFLLQQLEKRTPFGVLPQYDIRGSITQFDEDVVKKEAELGVGGLLKELIGFRASRNTALNVLGFDASVISVPDLQLLPGVTSKNTVIVSRDERSVNDGQATIQKVGVNFNMRVSRNAGVAQAVRNMVELASVELVGKLTRVPYWNCLGLDQNGAEVQREIEDWFVGMREEADRNRFFQEHLRFRKFYDGPVDGRAHPALGSALDAYKVALGFGEKAPTDLKFFTDFLTRPVPKAPEKPFSTGPLPPDAKDPKAAGGAPVAAAVPAQAGVTIAAVKPKLKVGEDIEFAVQSERSGYLYCYIQSGLGGAIQRIYPNRQVRDPRIEAGQMVLLPGTGGFRIAPDKPGQQNIACLVAPREVYNDLPPPARWGDFEDIRLKTFAEIKEAFEQAGKQPVVIDELKLQVTQ